VIADPDFPGRGRVHVRDPVAKQHLMHEPTIMTVDTAVKFGGPVWKTAAARAYDDQFIAGERLHVRECQNLTRDDKPLGASSVVRDHHELSTAVDSSLRKRNPTRLFISVLKCRRIASGG